MSVYDIYLPVFLIIGISTYVLRFTFLVVRPKLLNNIILQKGLERIPSSLLVVFVIPFTFFKNQLFLPLRIEVLAILLTIPVVNYTKRPGLSLPIALFIYILLNLLTSL